MAFAPANCAAIFPVHARVVELVDAPDSKSGTARCVGSIPTSGTTLRCEAAEGDLPKLHLERREASSSLASIRCRYRPGGRPPIPHVTFNRLWNSGLSHAR